MFTCRQPSFENWENNWLFTEYRPGMQSGMITGASMTLEKNFFIIWLLCQVIVVHGESEAWCIGSPLVVRDRSDFDALLDAKCENFIGSLEIRLFESVNDNLTITNITGYLLVSGIRARSINDLFPNLRVVMGLRKYRQGRSMCTVEVSYSQFTHHKPIHVISNDADGGSLNDCMFTNRLGNSIYTDDLVNITRKNMTLQSLPWRVAQAGVGCPTLIRPGSDSLTANCTGPEMECSCTNQYTCNEISEERDRTDEEDLPCRRICGESIIINTVESMCEIRKGCKELQGDLEIYINNINGLSTVPGYCRDRLNITANVQDANRGLGLERLDLPGGPLSVLFSQLEVIHGKLVLGLTQNIFSLDFFSSLASIEGRKIKSSPFANCSYRESANVILLHTSLSDISRLKQVTFNCASSDDGLNECGTSGLFAQHNNKLCPANIEEVCNASNINCDFQFAILYNGGQSFCQAYPANLTGSRLTWKRFNITPLMPCDEVYAVYFKQTNTMTATREACLGSDGSWRALSLENSTSLELSNHDYGRLTQCKSHQLVICGYQKLDNGTVFGIGYAAPNDLLIAPRTTVTVRLLVNVTGYSNYNLTVFLPYWNQQEEDINACNDQSFNLTVTATAFNCTNQTRFPYATSDNSSAVVLDWTDLLCTQGDDKIPPIKAEVCYSENNQHCETTYLPGSLEELDIDECERDMNRQKCSSPCVNTLGGYVCDVRTDSSKSAPSHEKYLFLLLLLPMVLGMAALALLRKKDERKYKARLSQAENMLRVNSLYNGTVDLEDYIEDPVWELVADSLTIGREVGEGAFGKVFQGTLATVEDGDLTVAIKTLSVCDNILQRNTFLAEASIMKKFDSPYVMRLMGLVSTVSRPLVVMEFMEEGDLRAYLMKCRPQEQQFSNRSLSTDDDTGPPTEEQCKRWALQLAKGMLHLNEKHFVHRDLAARNCMLAADLTLKIGDFGFTRDIYESDYYRKERGGVLPVRWLGPESLRDGLFISPSDVWSYGIVLWEMATLGDQPYPGKSHEEVMNFVIAGEHMEPPIILHEFPNELLSIMEQCWQFNPQDRPTFDDIAHSLDNSPHNQPLDE